jgi:hypothetical protein
MVAGGGAERNHRGLADKTPRPGWGAGLISVKCTINPLEPALSLDLRSKDRVAHRGKISAFCVKYLR